MKQPEHIPYGEQFQARKLLVAKATDEQIEAAAVSANLSVYRFADGSFIEWRKYGHQAFAPNGHNITPRAEEPHRYTEELEAYCPECDMLIRVKPGTDLDGTFKAWDVETEEFVTINGWMWKFEEVTA